MNTHLLETVRMCSELKPCLTCDWHVCCSPGALCQTLRWPLTFTEDSNITHSDGSGVLLLSASHQLSRLKLSSSGSEGVSPSQRNVEIQLAVSHCVCVCGRVFMMFIHTQCSAKVGLSAIEADRFQPHRLQRSWTDLPQRFDLRAPPGGWTDPHQTLKMNGDTWV